MPENPACGMTISRTAQSGLELRGMGFADSQVPDLDWP
jgi:hypothetical protein